MGKRKSKRGYWIAIWVLVFLLAGSWLVNFALITAFLFGGTAERPTGPVDEQPDFEEVWSYGEGKTKVVRIGLTGVIMRGRQERLFGYKPDMVESIKAQIQCATINPKVRAIVLEVDSPGGGVTPSDEIYEALQRFKRAEGGRKVLVHVRDLGASGAYYIAMAGDYLMAEPTAIVGSVGVIMQTLNMKGLGDKIGVSSVTIASGENKDLLNPFEEIDPAHMALLQRLVDGLQDRFASIVEQARGLESRDLLDGRIFDVNEALEHGLIDGVGYWPDALEQLKLMLKVDGLHVVRYEQTVNYLDALLGIRIPSLHGQGVPSFLYLWRP